MSFDPNQSERFFVPSTVIHFLVAITLPTPVDRVLNINLDSSILTPEITNKIKKEPDYVRSNPTPEDLKGLEQTYDIILCGPTFGISAGQLPGGNGEPGEEFWLKWSISHLSKSGRLAVIVPNGLLANYSQQNIRKFLLEKCDIQAIIELPLGWSQGTSVQASILLITPPRNPERDVKMFRFPKFETIPWDVVTSFVLGQDDKTSYKTFTHFVVKASQLSPGRLDVSYHDPKYAHLPLPDPSLFKAVHLSELVRIDGGERLTEDTFSSYGIPYIQVGNIGSDGNLYLRDARLVDPERVDPGAKAGTRRWHCVRDDLIITVAGTVGKVALIDVRLPSYGVYINTSSRRLRVKNTDVILPEYLFIHLRSEIVQQQIVRLRSGSVIPVLSNAELGKITVYVPPLEKQRELISSLREVTLKQTHKLLFHFYGVEQIRDTEQVQKSTVKSVVPPQPPLEEVVKEEFPFPIARAFSIFQRSTSERYSDQLRELVLVSEAVVYYLSSICIVDQVLRLKIAGEDLLSNIRKSTTDRSMQRRIDVITFIQRLARQDSAINLFVPEIVNAEVGICTEINKRIRNVSAHTAPKSEYECEQLVKEFHPKLKRLLESLAFLKDYQLVRVTPVAYRKQRYGYRFEYLTGDNDVFQAAIEYLENYLFAETGHVLLMNSKNEVLDLYPFYLFYAWERTGKQPHLCFFKYYAEDSKRDPSKRRLKIESTLRVGEYDTDSDEGLEAFLDGGTVS